MARLLASLACLVFVASATATEPERSRKPAERVSPDAVPMEAVLPGAGAKKAGPAEAMPKKAAPGRVAPRGLQRGGDRVEAGQLRNVLRSGRQRPGPGASKLSAPKPDRSGVYCMGGQYLPCWCEGASDCNNLISACVETGHEIYCFDHDDQGKPSGCSCG